MAAYARPTRERERRKKATDEIVQKEKDQETQVRLMKLVALQPPPCRGRTPVARPGSRGYTAPICGIAATPTAAAVSDPVDEDGPENLAEPDVAMAR